MENLSPSTPIITLTTDFGVSSRYVAVMKGVILSLNPLARLVDLTHAVPAQNIMAGAMALAETVPYYSALMKLCDIAEILVKSPNFRPSLPPNVRGNKR